MSNTNGFVNLPVGIYLNIRKEPNFYSTVLGSLAPKTNLNIIEQNGQWYKIEYNNSIAYVFAVAVTSTSDVQKGGISLNLTIPNNEAFGNAGEEPTFNWNALVTTGFIPIKNESGQLQNGYGTSDGDHITIIKDNPQTGLTFIQYPDQGANMYQQGWIDSSYISKEYLDFRFEGAWINSTDNQEIYLFNQTISNMELGKDMKYTLLYTVSNYNVEYSVILFDNNGSLSIGFTPSSVGMLNFIVDGYPYNILNQAPINTIEPTITPNAIIVKEIDLIDINGIKSNYYTTTNKKVIYPTLSVGTKIAILQVFNSAEQDSILIEYFNSGSNSYLKGYLPTEALFNNSISVNKNNIEWNKNLTSVDLVNLTATEKIYTLPISQSVQYLYSTDQYACILFNNNNLSGWPLETGYVSLTEGTFKNANQILDDSFSAVAETLYFSQENIVINVDIESKTVFSHALEKNLILRATANSASTIISTVSVNWYSSNKDDYSGFQAVITPEITKSLLENVNYNLFVQFTLNDSIIGVAPFFPKFCIKLALKPVN
ncbi:MAG: SH3 domain-containing protein [Clostridium sp.]|uniref:SH3 domain-containing protein n=1 Tax=Clostridium sp. TaxID=1506 RepID=UPI003EE6B3AA